MERFPGPSGMGGMELGTTEASQTYLYPWEHMGWIQGC